MKLLYKYQFYIPWFDPTFNSNYTVLKVWKLLYKYQFYIPWFDPTFNSNYTVLKVWNYYTNTNFIFLGSTRPSTQIIPYLKYANYCTTDVVFMYMSSFIGCVQSILFDILANKMFKLTQITLTISFVVYPESCL